MRSTPIYLCNEVLRAESFAGQCRIARELGYDGLEIAPFTLAEDPSRLRAKALAALRGIAEDEGLRIGGLHWLLNAPEGLSITASDPATRQRTLDFGHRLVEICCTLGGGYLVHGSPGQRRLEPGDRGGSLQRAEAYFAAMGTAAQAAGCLYLLEPLSARIAESFTSLAEAVDLVRRIDCPGFATMLDCYAAASDGLDVARLLEEWLPSGALRHIHLNDDNAGAPGQGSLDFAPILDRLAVFGYQGALGVEPFDYLPDPVRCAAAAITHLRPLLSPLCSARPEPRSL